MQDELFQSPRAVIRYEATLGFWSRDEIDELVACFLNIAFRLSPLG